VHLTPNVHSKEQILDAVDSVPKVNIAALAAWSKFKHARSPNYLVVWRCSHRCLCNGLQCQM
jgi:hypothetical protein